MRPTAVNDAETALSEDRTRPGSCPRGRICVSGCFSMPSTSYDLGNTPPPGFAETSSAAEESEFAVIGVRSLGQLVGAAMTV